MVAAPRTRHLRQPGLTPLRNSGNVRPVRALPTSQTANPRGDSTDDRFDEYPYRGTTKK